MRASSVVVRFTLALIVLLMAAMPAAAGDNEVGYRAASIRLDLADYPFSAPAQGSDPYPLGGYYGGNYYNGGNYWVKEAIGPETPAAFDFSEAIASWNATTPPGTWIEVQMQARLAGRWTKWFIMGIWASGTETVQRHSVRLQGNVDGYVAVDTLVLTDKKVLADAFRVKLLLFSVDGTEYPSVQRAWVAYSTAAPKKTKSVSAGNPALWNTLLAVPECSQMVYTYPEGGNVWCSPTSTSMVLGFWGIDPGECPPRVRATVAGVFDWVYDGHGNWPFNTAYTATRGMEAYVTRFTGLDQVEPWVAAGVPVVVSFAWGKNDLTGAAVKSSSGHLSVIVGFDDAGNPIVNDPAAASDEDVQRMYLRAEFEPLWLANSGGTVYLIYPPDRRPPDL